MQGTWTSFGEKKPSPDDLLVEELRRIVVNVTYIEVNSFKIAKKGHHTMKQLTKKLSTLQ